MIRGLFQNAVIIKNPRGGRVFSQAIFILRPGTNLPERELSEEAEIIIREHADLGKRRNAYK